MYLVAWYVLAAAEGGGDSGGVNIAGLVKDLGVPTACLVVALLGIRTMWASMTKRDDAAIARYDDLLAHERKGREAAEQREQDLHRMIREQIVPALTQSTAATVEAIQILRRERK